MRSLAPFTLLLAGVLALAGTGCNTVIPPKNLLPSTYDVRQKHPVKVLVRVTTPPVEAMSYYHFTGEGFATALAQALQDSGAFAKAVTSGEGDYRLEGQVNVEFQPFGASFTHHIRSSWKLVRQSDGKEVWSDLLTTQHTATMGEAFAGMKRSRLATEGVAKKCIQEVVHRLSILTL